MDFLVADFFLAQHEIKRERNLISRGIRIYLGLSNRSQYLVFHSRLHVVTQRIHNIAKEKRRETSFFIGRKREVLIHRFICTWQQDKLHQHARNIYIFFLILHFFMKTIHSSIGMNYKDIAITNHTYKNTLNVYSML